MVLRILYQNKDCGSPDVWNVGLNLVLLKSGASVPRSVQQYDCVRGFGYVVWQMLLRCPLIGDMAEVTREPSTWHSSSRRDVHALS